MKRKNADQEQKSKVEKSKTEEEVKPEGFENLKATALKIYSELKDTISTVDKKSAELDKIVKHLESIIPAEKERKKREEEELKKFRDEVNSIVTEIHNYKSKLEGVDKKVGEIETQYSQLLESFHASIIGPYQEIQEILKKGYELMEEVKRIEDKVERKVSGLLTSLEYIKSPQAIKEMLARYAVRRTPEEESVLVTELLDKPASILEDAIKRGRSLGYTDEQLMVLIGAWGLLHYIPGEGVDKKAADAIKVNEEVIEDYIGRIGAFAKDNNIRAKILARI
jgi:DNA repair exonuclease SbcCD ATPase subunit